MNTKNNKIAILIPMYNEEETIGYCINEAQKAIKDSNIEAQIIVIDNDSTDKSVEIAKSKKVKILFNNKRGYGSNLHYGIINSNADIVFFADADGSYPFSEFKNFISKIIDDEINAEFVLGNRFSKNMESGSMPLLNKYIGTPILTFFINFLFDSNIKDCNCGMRAIRVDSYKKLNIKSLGMEYASEMIIKSIKHKLKTENCTFKFSKDLRSKKPHLDRWIDGWRHLRFILCSTDKNIVILTLGFISLGLLVLSSIAPAFSMILNNFPFHTCLILVVLYVLSNTILITFITTRLIMHLSKDIECKIIDRLLHYENNNKLMVFAYYLFTLALTLMLYIIIKWAMNDFERISEYHALVWMSLSGITASIIFYLDVVISNFKNFFTINN